MSQKLDRFQRYLDLYGALVKVNAGKFVDEQLTEDVTQETFMKMYEHLDYLNEESVKEWLVVVSGNIAKDYVKKGGNLDIRTLGHDELLRKMDDTSASAEESYEENEKQKAARNLLRTACSLLYTRNPNWYYVMIDSCMLDMGSREIAEVLGTSAGNVDVMKRRARAYLQKHLGKDFHEFF